MEVRILANNGRKNEDYGGGHIGMLLKVRGHMFSRYKARVQFLQVQIRQHPPNHVCTLKEKSHQG